jgi:hypothetical protein
MQHLDSNAGKITRQMEVYVDAPGEEQSEADARKRHGMIDPYARSLPAHHAQQSEDHAGEPFGGNAGDDQQCADEICIYAPAQASTIAASGDHIDTPHIAQQVPYIAMAHLVYEAAPQGLALTCRQMNIKQESSDQSRCKK